MTMRGLGAMLTLAVTLIATTPLAVHAGAAADAALALGAFAVFSQLLLIPALARPVYAPPPVAYPAPAMVVAPAPPPSVSREVVYRHGRHVLLGDGVTRAYQWVWVPNPPAGPPPPAPPR
jgi:hypothetical protein